MQELTLANENELRPTRRDTNKADLTDIPMPRCRRSRITNSAFSWMTALVRWQVRR